MAIFEQNPEGCIQVYVFQLLKEADAVVADLGKCLQACGLKKATNEQIVFLDDRRIGEEPIRYCSSKIRLTSIRRYWLFLWLVLFIDGLKA